MFNKNDVYVIGIATKMGLKIMIYGCHYGKIIKSFFLVPSIEVLHRIHNNSAFNAKGNNLKVENLKKKYYIKL